MASAVDICNLALSHLGDPGGVTAIDPPDSSVQASWCAVYYPIALKALLERYPWRFATQRALLDVYSHAAQPTSWEYSYEIPTGCVKPLKVLPEEYVSDQQSEPFTVELDTLGVQVIYSNVENATLLYTEEVTDATTFTPLFVLALARLLASFLAGVRIKGTTGIKVAQGHLELFEKVDLPLAISADSTARFDTTKRDYVPSAINARS